MTPLHNAASNGHGSIVECLIKSGANVNVVDNVSYYVVDMFSSLYHVAA